VGKKAGRGCRGRCKRARTLAAEFKSCLVRVARVAPFPHLLVLQVEAHCLLFEVETDLVRVAPGCLVNQQLCKVAPVCVCGQYVQLLVPTFSGPIVPP